MLELLSERDRRDAAELARLGDLAWMLDEHQDVRMYRAYRDWEARMHEHDGDGLYNCFMFDAARQVGKTFVVSLIRCEDAIRYPGTNYISACATEVSLAEFIIPNLDTISEYIPEDIRPQYVRNRRGMRSGYWFPNGSKIKLVGMDLHPKHLRGPKCDGCSIHEAAYVSNLAATVVSVIQPQFQRGRDPTLILESSAPEDADHDFDVKFKPSCEKRRAYVFMTIHDNTALSKRKVESILAAARELDKDRAAREYEGKRVRDRVSTVFPETGEHLKLESYGLPKYGIAICTLDPGQVHLFAVNWSVFDVSRQQVIYVDDWAESNPSTERVAAIIAAREYALFGTPPNPKLARIPLDDSYDNSGAVAAAGWRTLLAGDKTEHLAERLHSLAQRLSGNEFSSFQWYDSEAQCWRSNPTHRVSDTNLQVINDLSSIYGLSVNPVTKDDSVEAMSAVGRGDIIRGRVRFAPDAEQTYKHVHAAKWNKQRTKFAEHTLYGHVDLAACFVYGQRFWEGLYNIWPDPPEHLGRKGDDWVGGLLVADENDRDEELGDFF